ncbi:hypothetical protein Dimus_035982, partial [Dionaea muscipula]
QRARAAIDSGRRHRDSGVGDRRAAVKARGRDVRALRQRCRRTEFDGDRRFPPESRRIGT